MTGLQILEGILLLLGMSIAALYIFTGILYIVDILYHIYKNTK